MVIILHIKKLISNPLQFQTHNSAFQQVSFFAVCFIALDRYGALRYPLRYKILITYRRSVIATVSLMLREFRTAVIFLYDNRHFYLSLMVRKLNLHVLAGHFVAFECIQNIQTNVHGFVDLYFFNS